MKNIYEKKIKLVEKLEELLISSVSKEVFPGGVIGISFIREKIRENIFLCVGYTDYKRTSSRVKMATFYDIASLTKPLATTLSVLILIKKNLISFDSKLDSLLEIKIPNDKKNISLYNLLNHSSGLPAHKKYYKNKLLLGSAKDKKDIAKIIIKEKLEYKTSEKQRYSDIGFLLLGSIIEKKTNMSLAEFSKKHIYEPLGISENIFFNNNNTPKKGVIFAPTENCKWREKVICGQVHDDNAYALGGVCGHAGLFSNIHGVVNLVNFIIDIVKGRKEFDNINREDLIRCVKRQSNIGSWGLGFDTPSENSSSGKYFSKKSFGHLGFTGTSFWVDLEKDISIVLLTNRVNPNRDNIKIRNFRKVFHDLIMSSL